MEDSEVMKSYLNWNEFDFNDFLNLEHFDFDTALNFDTSGATNTSVDIEQKQDPVPSAERKRRLHGTTRSRIKRQKVQHSHVCDVHQAPSSKPSVRCFGKWTRTGTYKGANCHRSVVTFIDGQLPVCSQHRTQIMKMMRCDAILECGHPCNEMIPWKPHAYRLCEVHWSQGECYFLNLPVEIRLMIYEYLIPDKIVPSQWFRWGSFRHDRASISTAIFRVCKSVHEEFADLFYGQTTFEIQVTNDRDVNAIFMCNKDPKYRPQLMFMDHLASSRQMRSRLSASRTAPSRPTIPKLLASGIKYDFKPWKPSVSMQYFQRIRSFRFEISFATSKSPLGAGSNSQSAANILVEAERNILCDYLHRLVECLVINNQVPLRSLDINIRILGLSDRSIPQVNSKAIEHCQALFNSIRRLRTRTVTAACLIKSSNGDYREIDLLAIPPNNENSINKSLETYCEELTSMALPQLKSLVLVRYGQLTEIVSQMSQHPYWRETDLEDMDFILHNGRSAREADDINAMDSAFRELFNMLKKFNSDHQGFMKQMKQTLEPTRSTNDQGLNNS